jgi:hypothetical protein
MIPPITDALGNHWAQPAVADILLTDTHATMSQEAFDNLREYSTSMPSGVYPGKMWKAQPINVHTRTYDGDWYLRWYGIVPGQPELCSNNQRVICIMDWKAMMGMAA